MDLSELSLEQAFEDWSFGSGNVLAVVAGAVLLRFGWTVFNILSPPTILGIIAILYVYLAALGVLVAGAAGVNFKEHGSAIGYLVLSVLVVVTVVVYVGLASAAPGSDAAAFMDYAGGLVLEGDNPYAAEMTGAWNATGTTLLSVTPRIDGTHVTQYSYPSGLILLAVPAAALDVSVTNVTVLGGLAVLAFLVLESPGEWMLAPVAALLANNWLHVSFLGSVDVLWVLPVLLAMRAWYDERWLAAGALLGAASTMKPQPWLLLPFLAVELYRHRDWNAVAQVASGGVAVAALANFPFVLWEFSAWLRGVLTPIAESGASMIHDGVGLTMLTTTGAYVLPKNWYLILFAGLYLLALVATAAAGDRARWAGWVLPLALLIVNYRSLHTYFLVIVPLAYYAVLLDTDRVEDSADFLWRKDAA